MPSRKAQADLIFVVLIFWLAISLAFAMFFLTAGHQNKVEKTVEKEISYKIGDIRKRSTITTTMNDYMWRAPGVKNDYGGEKAYKIISYYFSTPGNSIYIDGGKIPREEVRNDLKTYLKYKMNRYWNSGANRVDYYLNITQDDPGNKPLFITVKRSGYYPRAEWSAVTYPIALREGSANVVLWTKTSKGIYGVSGD